VSALFLLALHLHAIRLRHKAPTFPQYRPEATNQASKHGSRGGRRGNNDQPGGLQRQNTGPRDGNATPQQGRRGGAGRGQNPNKTAENTANGPAVAHRNDSKRSDAATAPAQEEHIPVNDFNAQEVRAGLKNTSEVKPAIYKLAEKVAPAARSGSPWASKRTYPTTLTTSVLSNGAYSEHDRKWQRFLRRTSQAGSTASAEWRDHNGRLIRGSWKPGACQAFERCIRYPAFFIRST
jgi:hypothetical protein